MAITGDDVSLDQIVPVSRDFTLEEGATEGWGYESLSYGLPGHFSSCWGWGTRTILGVGCSVAKGLFASPQYPQMVKSTFLVSGPFSGGTGSGGEVRAHSDSATVASKALQDPPCPPLGLSSSHLLPCLLGLESSELLLSLQP